jgi:hypothetical protein
VTQYLVLIYQNEDQVGDPSPAMGQAHQEFIAANGTSLAGGNALERTDTATSVRPDGAGGFVVTDGPFAEIKEQLAGYYLFEAPNLDSAIALAKKVPVVSGGGVEVRPIRVVPGAVG